MFYSQHSGYRASYFVINAQNRFLLLLLKGLEARIAEPDCNYFGHAEGMLNGLKIRV